MGKRFHFISGLPRSGSTLLAAILRQNLNFSAEITSPLCSLFSGAINIMGGEGQAIVDDARRRRVLEGLFTSWAGESATVVFDTNRMWTARLAALLAVRPQAKVICTVRNVAAVMDSIERLMRANPLLPARLFNDDERANVYTRTEALSQRNRLVGSAWSALKEAYFGPDAKSLLLVDYDYLVLAPAKTMSLIYSFLQEEPFEHDFEHLDYDEPAFDEELRMPGLHKVRPRVSLVARRTLLPPDLLERFSAQNFWTSSAPTEANLILPRPESVALPVARTA